ncbi:MAG TPA: gliding motility-associated ABC transporter substrate-binding protein GldG [Bacteroidales bacterium]|nr:gliding motility-associated ABC transporter substrate-binding protein GldG [Bacteroidales bacterium]HPS17235.1 gliding motility-associated ABC transporter substrate-binding protein GldG [Bacteroidales bacterium]
MYTLFKREIRNFLSSLIGYIVITVFLLINGLFLWVFQLDFNVLENGYANIDGLFMLAPFVFLFLIPAITMRSFAEEKRSGTIEMLLTKPISDLQIVMAKYLAGVVLVLFSLLPTLIYYATVYYLGSPIGNLDAGGTWGSYIGLLFLAATFVSIGLFASSLTDNQIISFIISLLLCAFVYMGFEMIYSFDFFGGLSFYIQQLGINVHYSSISRGVVDTRDILYFLSVIIIFILLSKVSLESRKWSRHETKKTFFFFKNKKQTDKNNEVTEVSKKNNLIKQNIINFSLSLLIIISLNIISSFVFARLDLTSEKRYTLSKTTKKIVKNLDDVVYFKIYLDGDLPAGFKHLRNETREMLNQFRAYSDNIEYEFINPNADEDKTQFKNLYKQLVQSGLLPTSIQEKTNDGTSQKVIFPGAIVSYKGRELPLQLLNTQLGVAREAVLNNSIQTLEYNIASVIKKLSSVTKPKIAFIEGHGELDKYETGDISTTLSDYYNVERVTINHQLKALKGFKAIIIAKPDSVFDIKDKFIIDQFIMKGGKVLWLIDPIFASMDSLRASDATIGIAQKLGIEDQLFKYGVRLNYDLIQDIDAMPIPVKTGNIGTQPQLSYLPWYFFPVVMPAIKNPIVNNLNAVKFEFVSSIDTVTAKGISKTILLTSSKYSRTLQTPVSISLDIMKKQPDERLFNKSFLPVAVLLEGKFTSIFKNRLEDTIASNKEIDFKEEGVPTQMIVVSDGDIIKNQVQTYGDVKYPLPLGYDKYTSETFGNKDFLLNCIDYMCDDSGLMEVRSRELKLRLLDKTKTSKQKLMIQITNIGFPIFLIILFGIIQSLIRKRKYRR